MRTLHSEEVNQISGGKSLKNHWKDIKHDASREAERIAGQVRLERDRHNKASADRMGGGQDLSMEKAHEAERQKIQEYRNKEEI